jgi:hypothetical protein
MRRILEQNDPIYPIPIRKIPLRLMLSGKLEMTIIVATVNVPSDHIPVQSDTIARYMGEPVAEMKEIIFPYVTDLIPRIARSVVMIARICGISGAVIQSWFRIKSSYTPYPTTAIKGIETGKTRDRKFRRPKTITPVPESRRESSPIVNGGFVRPAGILKKLSRHMNNPKKMMTFCWFPENRLKGLFDV